MSSFVRYFTDERTGLRFLGILQGSGGTAVSVETIRDAVRIMRERGVCHRFFEPRRGHVRIWLWPESDSMSYDDPDASVELPLASLRVDCKACVELREEDQDGSK